MGLNARVSRARERLIETNLRLLEELEGRTVWNSARNYPSANRTRTLRKYTSIQEQNNLQLGNRPIYICAPFSPLPIENWWLRFVFNESAVIGCFSIRRETYEDPWFEGDSHPSFPLFALGKRGYIFCQHAKCQRINEYQILLYNAPLSRICACRGALLSTIISFVVSESFPAILNFYTIFIRTTSGGKWGTIFQYI